MVELAKTLSPAHVAVIVPNPTPFVYSAGAWSIMAMLLRTFAEGIGYSFISCSATTNAEMRNGGTHRAMDRPEVTHLLYCDCDQIYPPDTIIRLLAHWRADPTKRVVGVPIPIRGQRAGMAHPDGRSRPFMPNVKDVPDDWQTASALPVSVGTVPEWEHGLRRVSTIGTGCVMVHRSVIEEMEPPIFRLRMGAFGGVHCEDDIAFCLALRGLGEPIWADWDIDIQHLTTMPVTREWEAKFEEGADVR